jgi:MoaE-MoaD fusion protein
MRVRVLSFARVREIVGAATQTLELPADATGADLWRTLADEHPALREIERSTRLARGGVVIDRFARLHDGDEVALLPPFGGG